MSNDQPVSNAVRGACPQCKGESHKVLMYGLPMRFCKDDSCRALYGLWSNLIHWGVLEFNGWMFFYTGWYIAAVIKWLMSEPGDVYDE